MAIVLSALAFIRGSRGAQIALVLAAIIIAGLIALKIHDRSILRADRERAAVEATARVIRAGHAADEALIPKQEAFNASQADLQNASSVDEYFSRLRMQQQQAGKHSAAAGKADVRR